MADHYVCGNTRRALLFLKLAVTNPVVVNRLQATFRPKSCLLCDSVWIEVLKQLFLYLLMSLFTSSILHIRRMCQDALEVWGSWTVVASTQEKKKTGSTMPQTCP